jgi:RimJ/RimL family protein N-acetyltransferase
MALMEWLYRPKPAAPPHPHGEPTPGLNPFEPAYARLVAGWVRSDDELFALAPRTLPPLTPRKVLAWKREHGYPMLYRNEGETEPCGYVELNLLPYGQAQWWVGHCLVAPGRRGTGIGLRMVDSLLDEAFRRQAAQMVSLVVFPQNFGAIRCYRRAGFSERGEVFRHFTTRSGPHRMLYMSLDRHEYDFRRHQAAAQHLRHEA